MTAFHLTLFIGFYLLGGVTIGDLATAEMGRGAMFWWLVTIVIWPLYGVWALVGIVRGIRYACRH